MRALIQRVKEANVSVDSKIIARIGEGLLVFIGIKQGDTRKEIDYIVDKTVNMRIFEGDTGKMDLSAMDLGKELLIVSQFTLYGSCDKGRRPDFAGAAPIEEAKQIYGLVVDSFAKTGLKTLSGQFQAYMAISLVNDGPVTIMLESK
jgi:D-aminoacyl-tRNA deacylase